RSASASCAAATRASSTASARMRKCWPGTFSATASAPPLPAVQPHDMTRRHPVDRRHYDALVVGARCAGAATAMLMARRGMKVLLVDRAAYGTDTMSTHALMRGAVLQLHRWGLLPRLHEVATPAVRSTSFHYGEESITVPIRDA